MNKSYTTITTATTAFAYLRIAARKPPSQCGRSISWQSANLKRTADALGIKIIQRFVDHGASGQTLNRPAMQKMIAAIESEDYNLDFVMVESPHRLTRNFEDYIWFMKMLERNGVRLICAAQLERSEDNEWQ
jgi:DNA invertase Pin-like site-specific DNA recombinase